MGYGGYRTSCGIEEITAELRQLTGNKAISMQTVVAILSEMNACVFRRAAKSKHLRVYPASTGMLQTNVGQFQRDFNLGRVPAVLPAVVLEAMWDAPASEPLIPTKYTISWNGNVFYDARIDCPSEMLRFPTRAIADLADGDSEMTPVPREASGAATIYEENIQTRQWDSSRSM